ncbi:MAG: hypothetical protein HZA84_04540 [Thaumarchaeota archaeon]|nr:hypothetical protein [Nitrososphaerota archaeon]
MITADLLLQIDATIITGALILMTITSFTGKNHEAVETGKKLIIQWTPYSVASGTIAMFGGSALLILMPFDNPFLWLFSLFFAGGGFVYLIISAIVVGVKEQVTDSKKKGGHS